MATYYWVGGAGTWDATTTTNWATSSGGAGSAGVPTLSDDVIFDSLSHTVAYAVTVGTNAVAADITIAGPASGNVTITSSATSVINCYGSWTNAATGVAFSSASSSVLQFQAATTGKTVTTNNVSLGTLAVYFITAGGGWTLGSALTTLGGMFFSGGTFSSANFSITALSFNRAVATVASVSLGSSTCTLSGGATAFSFTNITGLTWDAGTSTIIFTGTVPGVNPNGLSLYNLSFTNTAGTGATLTNVPVANNISFTARIAFGVRLVTISVNLVCNSIDWGSPANETMRVGFASNPRSISRTLTIASPLAVTNVDFRDINYASGTMTGTSLGNAGNNSNITFTAAKTVYWNLAAGSTWPSTVWATSSGGTPALANFPLAQDTAIIDNTGLTAGNTITVNAAFYLPAIDMSTRTANMTLATGTTSPTVCGDFTCQSSGTLTITGTGTLGFGGPLTTQTITSNGVAFTQVINILGDAGNSIVLGSALTASSSIALTSGTLNMSNYVVTGSTFSSSTTLTRTLAFGTAQMYLTGNAGNIWAATVATNFSYTGTGIVNLTYAGSTGQRVIGHGSTGGTEANTPSFNVTAGTDNVAFNNNTRAKNLNFTGWGAGGVGVLTFNISTVYGNLTLATGSVTGTPNTVIFGSTSGVKTITTNGVTINCNIRFDGIGGTWEFQDALTMDATRSMAIYNGVVKLKAGTTSTVGLFITSGSNMKYLSSTTPGVQAILSAVTGTFTVNYLTITDIVATGGATWNAPLLTNIDGGNNTGWIFDAASGSGGGNFPAFGFGFRI